MIPYFYFATLQVPSYNILAVAGIICGFSLLIYTTRPIDRQERIKLLLFAAVIIIPFYCGARGWEMVVCLLSGKAGCLLSFWGDVSLLPGLITATLFAFPIARLLKTDPWIASDYFAPSIAAGCMFAKMGCQLRGCCFGIPPSNGWEFCVNYPYGSYPYTIFAGMPLLPVQLFESTVWLFILIILLIRKKNQKFSGELMVLLAFFYSAARFFLELMRYQDRYSFPTPVQITCAVIFFVSIIVYLIKSNFTKKL
ncbi:MAG: prolipoprotein diacylglyceryl transferase [Spirochaetia bacterium]|nr:prolipoprotein diacylglyceryl transferase [Spirochaetia bacterium]